MLDIFWQLFWATFFWALVGGFSCHEDVPRRRNILSHRRRLCHMWRYALKLRFSTALRTTPLLYASLRSGVCQSAEWVRVQEQRLTFDDREQPLEPRYIHTVDVCLYSHMSGVIYLQRQKANSSSV